MQNLFDKSFLHENMMGPNSLIVIDELGINLPDNARVLDLGCGKGLTSLYLADKFNAQIYAADLWISPSENYARFQDFNLKGELIPLSVDALNLPFAENYFDAVISIDSYHYFGNNANYFPEKLRPILKKDALVALAFPGMKIDVQENTPEHMQKYWDKEALPMWQTVSWWQDIFNNVLSGLEIKEMTCFDKAWQDWLESDNEYAKGDIEMLKADGGHYMNLISVLGRAI